MGAHFGAWCVVSSPLILGMELSDEKLTPVLDIITNEEAISVNQQWAGHPGMLVENILAPQVPYNPGGAVVPSSSAGDFDSEGASISGGRSDDSTSGSADQSLRRWILLSGCRRGLGGLWAGRGWNSG